MISRQSCHISITIPPEMPRNKLPSPFFEEEGRRRSISIVTILISCSLLLASVQLADSNFTTRISKISEALGKAINDVLNNIQPPDYTDFNINATFHASQSFNPRGMAGLYNLTNLFLDAVLRGDVFPEGE